MHLTLAAPCFLAALASLNLYQSANANSTTELPVQSLAKTVDVAVVPAPTLSSKLIQESVSSEATSNFPLQPKFTGISVGLNHSFLTSRVAERVVSSNNQLSQASPPVDESNDSDDALGEIEIVTRPTARRQPDIQLQLRSSGFLNLGRTGLVSNATLLATPKIGPETRLVAFVGGGVMLLQQFGGSDFNFLSFGTAVQQRLAEQTYGQLGFVQERLYATSSKKPNGSGNSLVDSSIRLSINRQDRLAERLRLDSFYELRASFADQSIAKNDQSRIANSLGLTLSHDIAPQLESALDYRIIIDSFTVAPTGGTKVRQQVSGSLTYRFSPQAFVGGSVSYLFGKTFDPFDGLNDLNAVVFSINLGLDLF